MAYVDAIYQATASYWQADDTTKWADSNPDSWELYARARQIEKLLNE